MMDFFNSMEHLEPKCPKCGKILEWGTTTTFSEERESHVCNNCGFVLESESY